MSVAHLNTHYIIKIMDTVEPYYVMMIIGFGLIGNSYSFIKFRSSKFKNYSASFHLANLFLVNNGFLVSLFIVSLKYFSIDVFNSGSLPCKLTIYSTYVFAFLSVSNIVLISLERLLLVFFPFRNLKAKRDMVNFTVSGCLCLFAMMFYAHTLITSGLNYVPGIGHQCQPHNEWFRFVQVMNLFDTMITFIIPFIVVLIINIAILVKMTKFRKKKEKSDTHSLNDINSTISPSVILSVTNNNEGEVKAEEIQPLGTKRSNKSIITTMTEIPDRGSKKGFKFADYSQQKNTGPDTDTEQTPTGARVSYVDIKQKRINKTKQIYNRMTRILLLISVSFLLTHFPLFLLQIAHFSQASYAFGHGQQQQQEQHNQQQLELVQHILAMYSNETAGIVEDQDSNKYHRSLMTEIFERFTYYMYYLYFVINYIIFDRMSIMKK